MELEVPKLFVVPLKIVKISEQGFLGPYMPPKIRHGITKSKLGRILSHFSTFLPYLTMKMTTNLNKILDGATHLSWKFTF